MSNINLLPWRAQHKARQTRRMLWQLVLVCLLTMLAVSAAAQYIKRQVKLQQWRHQQLLAASAGLDDTLRHIERVRLQDQQLQARSALIVQFQPRRNQAIHILNQLPTWLPSGVRLDSVQLTNSALEIKGQAQSYPQLSKLVQRIEQETWLSEPRLQAQALPRASLDIEPWAAKQFALQVTILAEPLMTSHLAASAHASQGLALSSTPAFINDRSELLPVQEKP